MCDLVNKGVSKESNSTLNILNKQKFTVIFYLQYSFIGIYVKIHLMIICYFCVIHV